MTYKTTEQIGKYFVFIKLVLLTDTYLNLKDKIVCGEGALCVLKKKKKKKKLSIPCSHDVEIQ